MFTPYIILVYLFSVVDDIDQPIVLVENSTVQRLETVHRHPVVSSLQNTNERYQVNECAKTLRPHPTQYTVICITHDVQTDRRTRKQAFRGK